ncbi:MAG: hypothetical protein IKH09_07805, partial [Clostridia bacterium]|nr:hypothetical protein [Clostridia bacterium]
YVITETTTEAVKNASGITEGTGANVLYMDVYVKDNVKENSDDPDFVIYGYTLFTTQNDAIDARDGATTNTVADAGKVEGFVDTTAGTADQYYTFDLTVKKVVVNDKATSEAHHEFPFTITFENETVSAKVLPIMTVSDNATQTALSAASLTSGSWTPTIADGATVTYVGIPCGTTFTINEKNDVVGTTYASVSTGADTNAESKNIYYNDISNNAVVNCTTALQAATENHTGNSKTVVFTNTLELISPTGVIVRVAPFALILLAGVALFVIVRRRRVED